MERNARNAEMERNARNAELDRSSRDHERSNSITAEIDRNGRSHEYERSNGREMVHSPELDSRHGRNMELEHSRARNGSMERELSRHDVGRPVGNDTERIQPLRSEPERKIPGEFGLQ